MRFLWDEKRLGWTPHSARLVVCVTVLAACLVAKEFAPAPEARSLPIEQARIDPNHASVEALMTLPGIGPVLAERIVAEREHGPYDSIDSVAKRVKGIGPVRGEQLKSYLHFDDNPQNLPSIGND